MVAEARAIIVSAVIPNMDRADLLAGALRSLFAQRLPQHVELEAIVVDNGSCDNSAEVASELGARAILLGSNQGVSRAFNIGIEASQGEWVVLLNNDVDLARDWLACMLGGAVRSGAWFATGKVFDASRRHLLDGAGDAVCRGGAAWRLGSRRPDGSEYSKQRRTFFPSATAALFRREFFDRAGLFDESFFAYLEDVDLGMRAAASDLRGVYLPEAVAWHLGSETGGRWSERSVTWITRHQILLLTKHYSREMLLRFARPVGAAQVLWAALAISRGRSRAWLRGVALGLTEWRSRRRNESGPGAERLATALLAGELEIRALQERSGPDTFWRWYFRLAGPPRRGL